jgi:uncharacterized membrane protein (UPF0127 family)
VCLADRALIADTSGTRRTGLLKHSTLEPGEGLWIVPCEGVHTFAMKFPIDIVYLGKRRKEDRLFKVLKIRHRMVRSRISFCLTANSVLELPAGTLAGIGAVEGDLLELEKYEA